MYTKMDMKTVASSVLSLTRFGVIPEGFGDAVVALYRAVRA